MRAHCLRHYALTLITLLGPAAAALYADQAIEDAAPPIRMEPVPRVTSFLQDAELDGRFVLDVDFEADGVVWLATASGLVKYDGYTWTRFTTSDGLPSDFVRSVCCARDGTIWVGTDHGVRSFDGSDFVEPPGIGPAGPNVRRIVEDTDGTLWFCSDQWSRPGVPGGLASYRDEEWVIQREVDGLPSDYVSDYFRDSNGREYVLTARGLAVRDGGGWERPLAEAQLAGHDDYFWSIVEEPSIGVMAATDQAFFVLEDDSWTRHANTTDGLRLPKLCVTADGEILSATPGMPKRLVRWNGTTFEPVSDPVPIRGPTEVLKEAPDGALWCVGYTLLMRWQRTGGEWMRSPTRLRPRGLDAAGRVQLVGDGAALIHDGNAWLDLSEEIADAGFDRSGGAWTYTRDLVSIRDSRGLRRFDRNQTGVAEIQAAHFEAMPGPVLFGRGITGDVVCSAFDGVTWRAQAPEALQRGELVRTDVDPAGRAWILLHEGDRREFQVVRIDEHGTRLVDPPPVHTVNPPNLRVDHLGGAWIYGDFGLYRHLEAEKRWRLADAPLGRNVTRMMNIGENLWLTNDGISGGRTGSARYDGERWTTFAHEEAIIVGRGYDGTALIGVVGALLRADPLDPELLARLIVPTSSKVSSAFIDRDETLWVGADEGLMRYRADGVAPETTITSSTNEIGRDDPLPVAFDGTEKYRHRGEGSFLFSWRIDDGGWSPYQPAPSEGIPAEASIGEHALEVRVRDEGGDVDPTPARFEFTVVPIPLQARWWFWPVTIVLVGMVVGFGAIAAISRVRIRAYATGLEDTVAERTAHLRESESRYRLLVDSAPYAIHETDREGRLISMNRAGLRMRRLESAADVVGVAYAAAAVERDRPRVQDAMSAAIGGDRAEVEFETPDDRVHLATFVPIHDDAGGVDRLTGLTVDITDRKRSEDRQKLMMNELDHRVKNNLASILSLADQAAPESTSISEFREAFADRVGAMARIHESLAATRWTGMAIRDVLQITLLPFVSVHGGRATLSGEQTTVSSRIARSLAMAVHEMATNAIKHGCLSVDTGIVHVSWSSDGRTLDLDWSEQGGPPVRGPLAGGAGISLIHGFVEHDLRGSVDLEPGGAGLRCKMSIPLGEDAEGAPALSSENSAEPSDPLRRIH